MLEFPEKVINFNVAKSNIAQLLINEVVNLVRLSKSWTFETRELLIIFYLGKTLDKKIIEFC